MSHSGGICASIFLLVSMVFIFVVHINGFVNQVPEQPMYAILYLPIPILFTTGSLAWLYFNYRGAEKGGYPVYVEDLLKSNKNK